MPILVVFVAIIAEIAAIIMWLFFGWTFISAIITTLTLAVAFLLLVAFNVLRQDR